MAMAQSTRTRKPGNAASPCARACSWRLGLALAGVVILLLGKERMLFDKQVDVLGAFENVDGLKLDAPVWLGGLEVGRVTKINFAPDLGDKRIVVTMEINAKYSRARAPRLGGARRPAAACSATRRSTSRWAGPRPRCSSPGTEDRHRLVGRPVVAAQRPGGEIIDNAVAITRDPARGASPPTPTPSCAKTSRA